MPMWAELFIAMGDTTTPWASFNQIAFTASYPLDLGRT